MRDSAFKIYQSEWKNSQVSVKKYSDSEDNNKGMVKARLGFIYFIVLVTSIIVMFTR